jgi:signal transduction histidine kinase
MQSYRKLFNFVVVVLLTLSAFANNEPPDETPLTIADLQNIAAEQGRTIQTFCIQGWVRAVVRARRSVILQDRTASAFIELPGIDETVRVGSLVRVEANNCLISRSHFGICIGTAPVVDNDGLHSPVLQSGSVFLRTGFEPIRLEWFNGPDGSALSLEYEGPNAARQKIPNILLWHRNINVEKTNNVQPGLTFSAYNGERWLQLPDFEELHPVLFGIATNVDLSYNARSNETALVFNGLINIARPGIYTFHLESDDGSRLWVGQPSVTCSVVTQQVGPMPPVESFHQHLARQYKRHWVEVEGEVGFVGGVRRTLEIELLDKETQNRLPVTIIEGGTLFATNLLHRTIRVDGICDLPDSMVGSESPSLIVPSWEQVQIVDSTNSNSQYYSTNDLLTTVEQVRSLKPDQAHMNIPVRIKGVVIAALGDAIVLQGASGGIYVHIGAASAAVKPNVGELWEIKGTTDSGDFSPVVYASTGTFCGRSKLPTPIHPTWEQLMNGSLDAEYVELRGVLTSISSNQITLLTSEGKVVIMGDEKHSLPEMARFASCDHSVLESIVQIRGCFVAKWDLQSRRVAGGVFYLWSPIMNLEEPAPLDPFSLPATKMADLLWFDARADALQRTKITGQIIYAILGEYFISDGHTGARIVATKLPSLQVGDVVDVVGFPKLGGLSLIMLESEIRKSGHSFPPPPEKKPVQLLDRHDDSRLVQVTATLINSSVHTDEVLLELHDKDSYFVARLKSDAHAWPTLPVGSLLQMTGVYVTLAENNINPGPDHFELLLRSTSDVTVIQRPSWWTARHSATVAATLGSIVGITIVWITVLQRTIKRQTARLREETETRQKVARLHYMERERSRIARDLHDELGAGLTEVGILGALAKNPAISLEEKEQYLAQLIESSRLLVTGLDEIVWAVNPNYDSLGSLVTYYSLFARSFLKLAKIKYQLQVVEPFPEYSISSKIRHEVFLAFKEALNNIVRHAQATEVQVKMEVVKMQLEISIFDDGRGMEFSTSIGQDGIIGMRERLRQLGGECQIHSQTTRGTKIAFHIPLREMTNYD